MGLGGRDNSCLWLRSITTSYFNQIFLWGQQQKNTSVCQKISKVQITGYKNQRKCSELQICWSPSLSKDHLMPYAGKKSARHLSWSWRHTIETLTSRICSVAEYVIVRNQLQTDKSILHCMSETRLMSHLLSSTELPEIGTFSYRLIMTSCKTLYWLSMVRGKDCWRTSFNLGLQVTYCFRSLLSPSRTSHTL